MTKLFSKLIPMILFLLSGITYLGLARRPLNISLAELNTPNLYTGVGTSIKERDITYLFYSRVKAGPCPPPWRPFYAISYDDGLTWIPKGALSVSGQFAPDDFIYPETIIKNKEGYYLFYNYTKAGSSFTDASAWSVRAFFSKNLRKWTDAGEVINAKMFNSAGALTNSCLIQYKNIYYMTISQLLGPHKFGIRLMKAPHPLGPWQDLGFIINPDNPQQSWYAYGAWDSEIFYYQGAYHILFGGRDSEIGGHFRNLGMASSPNIEGPYTVEKEPRFINAAGDIGGRSAIYFKNNKPQVIFDRYTKDHCLIMDVITL